MRPRSTSAPATPISDSPVAGSPLPGQGVTPRSRFDSMRTAEDQGTVGRGRDARAAGNAVDRAAGGGTHWPQTRDMGQKLLAVGGDVGPLKTFEREPITRGPVLAVCLETAVGPRALARH